MHMIVLAYGGKRPLKPAQVLGGPDWMKAKVFDIEAELPKSLSDQVKPPLHLAGPPRLYPAEVRRREAIKQVFRALLTNRFKLRVKHETQDLPVFELVSAKDGPKITKDKSADRPCRITDFGPERGLWMDVKSCGFSTFVGALSAIPELRSRVLVNKTGLHGRYSFKLHWTPKMPPGMPMRAGGGQGNLGAAPNEPSGRSLFTALRQQLGLRVVSGKAPVDVIAIEHIERPTPN